MPDHVFFEKTVLQRKFGDQLLQVAHLLAQAFNLARGRLAPGVAGEPLLARFQKLFRPAVIQTLGDALAAAQGGDALLAAQARHALTRHWWIGEDSLADIPAPYRVWHGHRLRDIREAPKRLAYDEFHRTAGAPAVRAQVERDVREARKLRVRLSLASQRLEDFGGALTELANRYWILGAGGKAREIEALSGIFALSETLQDAIRYRLPGPGKDGAPVLLIASDARGRFEQLVVNTPGPAELWALTTSPADVALRSRLQARLAPAVARAVLARAFPTGTARARIDAELGRLAAAGIRAGATEEDVLDRLAEELVPAAETTQSAFNPAGDDPAAAVSTGRSVPASQPTETEE